MSDTIIIDVGSGFMKAGLQSSENPTCIIPTLIGRPRRRYADLYEGQPAFVGESAISQRHQLSFTYPIDHGHIDDWLEVEEVFNHIFDEGLGEDPRDRSVLLTEPPLASTKHSSKLVEIVLELHDAAEVNLSIQGIMALYAVGRTTGLVCEIGEGVTQVVPVFDGYSDKACVRRSDFAGQEISMYLQKLLCDNGLPMTSRDDFEHVRMIKETLCYVALDPFEDDLRDDLEATYVLPDGMYLRDGATTSVTLGAERFYCAEALFDPRLMYRDNPPLTELLWQAIQESPMEHRKGLLGQVIISGGSSLFPGLSERLERELQFTAPPQARKHVQVHAHEDRLFGVWLGAKLFCAPSMRSMQDALWISKEAWEEEGESVITRKAALR